METKDLTNLLASSSSGIGSENNDLHRSICEPIEADFLPINSEVEEDKLNGEITGNNEADVKTADSQPFEASDNYEDLVDSTTTMQVSVELTEEIAVKEDMNSVHSENGYLAVPDRSPLGNHERDGSPISSYEKDGSSLSGVKRSRVTVDEQQPSVHVVYNSLSRDSKRKLEELLQKWSEWHARHYSSSHDSNEAFEYGEKTYFPALHVGVDKPSAVTFWMDSQTRNPHSKEFIPLDNNSVPLYDRGYSLGLTSTDDSGNLGRGMEIVDASRCFNCGSYNHSLKECPKPRDNVAVNNARKQQKSRRNQNASSRNPTRYYQNSPGGKYDGLRPGVLDVDTRQLLGLGEGVTARKDPQIEDLKDVEKKNEREKELDPPPWLKRMREIGYPPGYLDPEDVDQPSGITIFAEEESKEEKEDGEILDTDYPEPPRKMSVEFPGINAPIPENADERRWTAGPSSFDLSRNRSYRRSNHSSEPTSKGHYRDFRDDGPPGCDPGTSPSRSSYSERYGGYGSSYTSYSQRGNNSIPRSPSFDRSVTDRGRRSPLLYETSLNYAPGSLENRNYDHRRNDYTADSSSHKDKHDMHRRHSRR